MSARAREAPAPARRALLLLPWLGAVAVLTLGACASAPPAGAGDAPAAALASEEAAAARAAEPVSQPLDVEASAAAAASSEQPSSASGSAAAVPEPAAPDGEPIDESWLDEIEASPASVVPDPLEPVNRGVFGANRWFDRLVSEPIARAYARVVPEPGRRAIARMFDNLNEPVVFANEVLQLHPHHAAETGARFVVNTTAGVAGLFDVAGRLGLERHRADFGETLARTGLGPGFYLVLPLVGPSTARDAIGQLVDTALRLDTWLLSPGGRLVLAAGGGVVEREEHLRDLEELERASLDFYVAIRELYVTTRERRLREGH